MGYNLLIIGTFLISSTAFGQGNKVDVLTTGVRTEKFDDANGNYVLNGNNKIISLSQDEKIKEFGNNCYEVKYKGSTPLMFYEGKSKNNISVKDSIWNNYDQAGNLREVIFG